MSHHATKWALRQRGLRPSTKVVLWQLCDHHNPQLGCFPSVRLLAEECEMAVRSVVSHLQELETAGLIRRVRNRVGAGRLGSYTYFFAFEEDATRAGRRKAGTGHAFDQEPVAANDAAAPAEDPRSGAGLHADESSGAQPRASADTAPLNQAEKSPMDRQPMPSAGPQAAVCAEAQAHAKPRKSDVQNLHLYNQVREPGKDCVGAASGAHTASAFAAFWEAYPRPRNRAACEAMFAELGHQGADLEAIVAAARRYAAENAGNRAMYLAYADNWLRDHRWQDFEHKPDPIHLSRSEKQRDVAIFWASKVKSGSYVPRSAISAELASIMVRSGLVDQQELRRAGLDP